MLFFRLCLKCTLLGHPKPTVTWERNGELVDEERTDGHIRTRNEGNDYYLEIDEAQPEDAGKYGVAARNSLGKQTAGVDVVVSGELVSLSRSLLSFVFEEAVPGSYHSEPEILRSY